MQYFNHNFIQSKRMIITAGPTREAIEPVRFISTHSTGKMGYAIAEYLHSLGANVQDISGPANIKTTLPAEQITHVVTADEMPEVTQCLATDADVIIISAAVADYKCAANRKLKEKKQEGALQNAEKEIDFVVLKYRITVALFSGLRPIG